MFGIFIFYFTSAEIVNLKKKKIVCLLFCLLCFFLQLTEVLIEHGCNVDAKNFQGDTALHVMVRRNRLACAVMLLGHHADANIQNSEGNTPLHLAVKVSRKKSIKYF